MINKIKWVTWSLFIITVVYSLYYSFIKINQKNIDITPVAKNTEKSSSTLSFNENSKKDNKIDQGSSYDNQKDYLEKIENALKNKDLTENAKNALLLRKAIALSLIRSSNSPSTRDEAINILIGFVNNKNSSQIYFRDFSIVVLSHQYVWSSSEKSFSVVSPNIFNKYKDMGYNDVISKLLTLNELLESISVDRKNDIAVNTAEMMVRSRLLAFYKKELGPETSKKILSKLGESLTKYNSGNLLAKTYTDKMSVEIIPPNYAAFAYDVYTFNNNTSLSPKENSKIDESYENVYRVFKKAEDAGDDKIAINNFKVFHSERYLWSLNRRYGESVDMDKFNSIINTTLESADFSDSNRGSAIYYWKESSVEDSGIAKYFISLAKTHKNVADFFKKVGINQ